jgi:dTDP-4-amino-4,6-dideoxygalactose transaminase
MNTVDFYSGKAAYKAIKQTIESELPNLLSQEVLVNGQVVKQLEQELQHYTGAKNCIAVGNGTDALIILLKASGIGKGDEVIIPCYSFFASLSCVLHVGATPIFVDIDPVSYAMNPEDIKQKLTDKTRAIMPVHLFTQLADIIQLRQIADENGLLLLEDSAEGIGMFADNTHSGLFGQGGVLSFFPTKTLGAFGDAGLILTDDDSIAKTARLLRNLGRDHSGESQILGINSRMDDMQACFLLAKLAQLDDDIESRNRLANDYNTLLGPLSECVNCPQNAAYNASNEPVFYVYQIQVKRRDELVEHLTQNGITTETYYPRPLHLQPCIKHLAYQRGMFPVAEQISELALALPLFPDMTSEQVEYVCNKIIEFYQ